MPVLLDGIYVQHLFFLSSCQPYSGGYSTGVPPLPIPNREVKPVTPMVLRNSGRVGRRRFPEKSSVTILLRGTLFFVPAGRIPISSMQRFVTLPRSAASCPQQVLRHILTQCFVAPSYCTSSFFYPVLRCIPSFCFLPFCIKSIFLAKFFSFFFVHVHSFTIFAVYY